MNDQPDETPTPSSQGSQEAVKSGSAWRSALQVVLIVALVLLVQRVVLPLFGIGGT